MRTRLELHPEENNMKNKTPIVRLWIGVAAFIPALALALAPPPAAKPEDVGMSSAKLAQIDAAMAKEVADGSFRGGVVMVARKGKLVYHKAFGNQTASK